MTVGAALNEFFNRFGRAYANTSVPDDVELPYITYEVPDASFGQNERNCTVQAWFKTASEAVPNALAKDIKGAIGQGGVILPVDDGSIWLKRGDPWSIATTAEGDNTVKLRQMNVTIEFLTR